MEGIAEELQTIEKEVNSLNYTVAYRKLHKLQEREGLTKEDQIKIKVLLSRNVFLHAKGQKTRLNLAKEAVNECRELSNSKLLMEALIEVARGQFFLGKIIESLETIQEIEDLLKVVKNPDEIDYKKIEIAALNIKGVNYQREFGSEEGYKVLIAGLNLAKKLNIPHLILEIRFSLNFIIGEQRKYDQIEEWELRSIKIAEKANEEIWVAYHYIHLAMVYLNTFNRFDEAIELSRKAISIAEKNELNFSSFKGIEGMVHWKKGNLDKAIEIYESYPSDSIDEEGYAGGMARYNLRLIKGLYAWRKGDFDKAIKLLKRSKGMLVTIYIDQGKLPLALEQTMEMNNNLQKMKDEIPESKYAYDKAIISMLLAKIHFLQGNYKLALENVENCIGYQLNLGIHHYLIETLLLAIKIQYERNALNLTNVYLKNLEEIAIKQESLYYQQTFLLGKALALKATADPKRWVEAFNILENIITNKNSSNLLVAEAMISICELLITEFSYTGDIAVLKKLEKYTSEIEECAYKQNSFHIKLEATHIHLLTLWLKAQYSMVEIDLEKANNLLHRTRDMADEEGLFKLAEKLTLHHGEIITRIDQWAEIVKNYTDFLKE
jgi:tetratricopeptide (TPR) repeat protein